MAAIATSHQELVIVLKVSVTSRNVSGYLHELWAVPV